MTSSEPLSLAEEYEMQRTWQVDEESTCVCMYWGSGKGKGALEGGPR